MQLPGLRILVCALILSCSSGWTSAGEQTAVRAGWAEVDITPPLGIALGGRGPQITLARQVLDPLFAQVLYLVDSKGAGAAIVSLDLVGLPHALSDKIRRSLTHELGVDWNLTLLNCSHTHSGPNMIRDLMAAGDPAPPIELDYFNALHEKLVSAARGAKANAGLVEKIEVFHGASQVAINRRGINARGLRAMVPDPNGPIDENVWVMRISRQDQKPGALVFSYACHPVIVYGYAFAALSADFPGVARNVIREQAPSIGHVQYLQGLAGNVRPRSLADLQRNGFRSPKPEDTIKAGTELAEAVMSALKKDPKRLELDMRGAADRPVIPRGEPPPREMYEKMAADEKAPHLHPVARYWLSRYDSGEGFGKGEPWPIGLIRLAPNQWIVYLAGEPCVEWRAKVSNWLAPRNILPLGYSQEGLAYLPTEELLPEGGYEVLESNRARASSPAPFAPGIHDAVRQSLLRQLAFIEADVK